jgi:hypothetical protein
LMNDDLADRGLLGSSSSAQRPREYYRRMSYIPPRF